MKKFKTIAACILTLCIIALGAVGANLNRFGESVANKTIVFVTLVCCIVSWAYCVFSEKADE